MFAKVEKLLSELRSTEVRRNVPPTGTSTRQASILGQGGGESVKDDTEEDGEEGEEECGGGLRAGRELLEVLLLWVGLGWCWCGCYGVWV